jgi:predicted O-methyltransferase YrrM
VNINKRQNSSGLTFDFFDFCPDLRHTLETGEAKTADGSLIKVHSSSTLSNLYAIRKLILERKPTQTLEVGLAHGVSAMCIAATMREVHGDYPWHHTAIDPFQDSDRWAGVGRIAAAKVAGDGHFTQLKDFSKLALPRLLSEGRGFGLIYVDGSHLFENVFIDAFFSTELLEQGGLILFDDCTVPHVDKVIRFLRSNYSHVLQPISPPSPMKPIKKRIANAFGIAQLKAFQRVGDATRPGSSPLGRF